MKEKKYNKQINSYGYSVVEVNGINIFCIGLIFNLEAEEFLKLYGVSHTKEKRGEKTKAVVMSATTDHVKWEADKEALSKARKDYDFFKIRKKYEETN